MMNLELVHVGIWPVMVLTHRLPNIKGSQHS
jgi:hypothetical protein